MATGAASVPEAVPAGAARADTPAAAGAPVGVPVVADRGYDRDPLRGDLAARGYVPVAPHRRGRERPPTADGRRLRRYRRRSARGRTFARPHTSRRVVTRFERRVDLHRGFAHPACASIALNRLVR